ncbi:GDP-mannose transporter into the lumen of the Golgi [Apiotrichum porosum]|uniref:GDP-mannose transporter n=1 Tax=Apiotrichum porosum TaxID=105984 RepID=A0A427Y4C7_9TREE|nr:GDP-mannose transporter into the lumen of the Golgi [Apiotrichum porosum]RSH85933.1 GDP-mannose transporter into the lumen of the Golgi [Apiotrichum porosum]
MSKPFVPTPSLSRSGSPPLNRSASSSSIYANSAERRGDEDKQALLMANLGGAPRPPSPSRADSQVAHTPSSRDQVLPIINYCAASMMMTVVNKYVVSGENFTMTFLLLAIQSAVCVLAVWSVKRAGFITFRELDMKDARAWWPISCLLVAVIYTGSKSLQFLNVSVYTIFKNLTIIIIAYGEVFMFNGSVTGLTLAAFSLMVGSSVISAWSDISAVWTGTMDQTTGREIAVAAHTLAGINVGYFWMFLNCLCSAAYVLFMRKRIKVTGFKDWDSMFYNNLLSIPVLVVFSLLFENWGGASLRANFPPENRTVLLSAIAFSGAAAVFISYSTAWCVRVCGSTTYSMVGALNKLPVAASGMLFFSDPVTPGGVLAISVGGIAGIVYAIAKTNQAKVEAAQKARLAAGGGP